MTKEKLFIYIILISYLTSCRSTNSISGKYRSNFAVHDFFVTSINLNTDSTFGYRSVGDVMSDTSKGHYRLNDKYVVLYHESFQPDTSEYKKYGKDAVELGYAFSTNKHLTGPEKFLVGHKKLFVCDTIGNVVKKKSGYSKHRQFLVFGKHWYKRRYYLEREY